VKEGLTTCRLSVLRRINEQGVKTLIFSLLVIVINFPRTKLRHLMGEEVRLGLQGVLKILNNILCCLYANG
jgi:hypothetical protein